MQGTRYTAQFKANLKKYGLSIDQYFDLLKKQGHGCAICGVHEMKLKRKLAVDHDHQTGKVRGLLCGNCNLALGQFEDKPGLLRLAAQYLEKNR